MGIFNKIFGNQKPKEPEILIERESPFCPILATVEQDDRVVYMYLHGPEGNKFGTRSCWVRNLAEAPEEVETNLIDMGVPPLLPKKYCRYPDGQVRLNKSDLEIVWLEEGDAAALQVNGEIIAVIPSWSIIGGIMGYSQSCIGQSPFAWELKPDNDLIQRINNSVKYFNEWDKEINPFQMAQPLILAQYEELFGKSEKYFAIDTDKGMPIGLFVKEGDHKIVFASVGMSLYALPRIEMYHDNRNEFNRIELGLILKASDSKSKISEIASWISGTCSLPWREITFLSNGHTVFFDSFDSEEFSSLLITNEITQLPRVRLEEYRGSQTKFYWMIPISKSEKEFAMNNTSKELIAKLNSTNEDLTSLSRQSVI